MGLHLYMTITCGQFLANISIFFVLTLLTVDIEVIIETYEKEEYDGKENPNKHVQYVDDRLNYYHTNEVVKCKLFALTMTKSASMVQSFVIQKRRVILDASRFGRDNQWK